jgi:hypothetical protein
MKFASESSLSRRFSCKSKAALRAEQNSSLANNYLAKNSLSGKTKLMNVNNLE